MMMTGFQHDSLRGKRWKMREVRMQRELALFYNGGDNDDVDGEGGEHWWT